MPTSNCTTRLRPLAFALILLAGCSNEPPTSATAVAALEYLSEEDGVLWHEVKGNNVFIGFPAPPPATWQNILKAAAIAGSRAAQNEFHAAGIQAESTHWQAYADSHTLGVVTAQDEEIVE